MRVRLYVGIRHLDLGIMETHQSARDNVHHGGAVLPPFLSQWLQHSCLASLCETIDIGEQLGVVRVMRGLRLLDLSVKQWSSALLDESWLKKYARHMRL